MNKITELNIQNINIPRCLRAMKNIEISGNPKGRESMIEEAISAIAENPKKCFKNRYLGMKNYASFGDQREDHEYGCGPRHGYIVFSIGRTSDTRDKEVELGLDEIYYLEAYRDFGAVTLQEDDLFVKGNNYNYDRKETLSLGTVLKRIALLLEAPNKYIDTINNAKFEFQGRYD